MVDALLASIVIPLASGPNGPTACNDGAGYYDPVHQICQPNIPGDPQPGYGRFCPDGANYDPIHGVCAPYQPATPPPMYPNY